MVTVIDIEVCIMGQVKTTHSRLWRWDMRGKCDLDRAGRRWESKQELDD